VYISNVSEAKFAGKNSGIGYFFSLFSFKNKNYAIGKTTKNKVQKKAL